MKATTARKTMEFSGDAILDAAINAAKWLWIALIYPIGKRIISEVSGLAAKRRRLIADMMDASLVQSRKTLDLIDQITAERSATAAVRQELEELKSIHNLTKLEQARDKACIMELKKKIQAQREEIAELRKRFDNLQA